ncbi:MAG: tRNA pseudouridine synthase tRNA pseudouridine55 synthase [Candidatus Parcubacteria bacterium]|jgi:tRNA pseudouridine55 synthase
MEIPKTLTIHKQRFETPLEALIRARFEHNIPAEVPMTYAGRLDPMAVGQMIVLVGEECKNRDEYLGRDKAYKLEVLFGIGTDTQDLFGVINEEVKILTEEQAVACMLAARVEAPSFVGTHTFTYPKYSTKGILAGDDEIPEREMTVTTISFEGGKIATGVQVKSIVAEALKNIHGDFRYADIEASWMSVPDEAEFPVIKLYVECASGTYMRTIAEQIGKKLGIPALAYYIERVRT